VVFSKYKTAVNVFKLFRFILDFGNNFFCMDATEMHKSCLSDNQGSQALYSPVPRNTRLFHNLVLNY